MSTRGTNRSPTDDSYEDVTPPGATETPRGIVRDDQPPEETIEFHPPEPNAFPQDEDDPSSDEDGEVEEEEVSVGSSVFSLVFRADAAGCSSWGDRSW